MPKQVDAEGPIMVRTVDDQGRLPLGPRIKELAPWLDHGGEYIASVGSAGGIRIEEGPPSREAALHDEPITEEEVASPVADYRRYMASRWKVKMEAGQWRIALPAELRTLGLLPNVGEPAVVFANGQLLEIWPGEDWQRHVRKTARRRRAILEQAIEQA